MQNIYVQKQENSQYISKWSTSKDDDSYVQVWPDNEQLIKLQNFTNKCYLNSDNALVVPNQVPANQQEQYMDNLKQQVTDANNAVQLSSNSAKTAEQALQTANQNNQDLINQLNESNQKIADVKQQNQMQGTAINALIKKINDLGGNGQQTAENANNGGVK
ncbi:hypothetical protein [Apilactobacillus apinorum]|uniref:hypothetical protein n=1 Tax=Apilactobacillus apinorum TaxID=1218495 RepID=UPI0006B4C192|nr:hypothetical protein [Apilactobacillus apinorum]KOY68987.1 hypothetical protein RZ74_07870 [Apilactobacillus apinorum]CAI2678915.1 Hypothetical protein AAPFHON13_08370 [Apilactobacillus apinorum]